MIEFQCSQCATLLRVPDDAAGKDIRCPSCNYVQQAKQPQDHSRDLNVPLSQPEPHYSVPAPQPVHESENPYQSPRYDANEKPAYISPDSELVHSKVRFTDVLTGFWNTFINKIGPCAITGVVSGLILLAVLGAYYVMLYVGIIILMVASVAPFGPSQPPQFEVIPVVIFSVFAFVGLCCSGLVYVYLYLGVTKAMLDVARGGEGKLGLLFVDFSLFARGIMLAIFNSLIALGATLVTAGPFVGLILFIVPWNQNAPPDDAIMVAIVALGAIGTILAMLVSMYINARIVWAITFLVDRNCTAIEALKQCYDFSRGNVISIILILFCFGMAFGILSNMTMGFLGIIFGVPAYMLLFVVIYLLATGQKMAFPPDGSGAAVANEDNYYGPEQTAGRRQEAGDANLRRGSFQ